MEELVKDLAQQGLGRRRIAKDLGISEYRVRAILRSVVVKKLRNEDPYTSQGTFRLAKSKSSHNRTDITAVMNDIHIPYHDQRAMAVCLSNLRDERPDTIVLNGDIMDFYTVSKYMKDPMRIDTLQEELDECRAFIKLLREEHPNAKIIYTKGNHEERLEKFLIEKAGSLVSLRCLAIDDLLGLSEFDVHFTDTFYMAGKLMITHGDLARSVPGSSARGHFQRTHSSVLIGHVHRLNVQHYTNIHGVHTLIENGCLCGMEPDYSRHMNNWQQGFSIVEHSQKSGNFEVHLRQIENGVLHVGKKMYTA